MQVTRNAEMKKSVSKEYVQYEDQQITKIQDIGLNFYVKVYLALLKFLFIKI